MAFSVPKNPKSFLLMVFVIVVTIALAESDTTSETSKNSETSDDSIAVETKKQEVVLKLGKAFKATYGYVPNDFVEAKCVPTKDFDSMNAYGGMVGYDVVVGNPDDGLVDPGVKSRIFLHDCAFGYYSFISDIGSDLNCDSDFSLKTISSMEGYDTERTSTNFVSFGVAVEASGSAFGISASASGAYARATNSEERAAETTLNKYHGEIIQAKATCITASVSISDGVRPVFTQDFINHLISMNDALEKDEVAQEESIKDFVTEFGTHFSRTTKFGAQLTYERRFETKATSRDEKQRRAECVENEAVASVSASRGSFSGSVEGFYNSSKCNDVSEESSFALDEGFTGTRILTRGSKPTDLNTWVDSDFDPVPIKRFLDPITMLFKDEWLSKSIFYGFEKSLSGTRIKALYEKLVHGTAYCTTMLKGVLDENCDLEACQNFGCYNGGTPETTDLNGEKTCVCRCMPGISGDHCEETKDAPCQCQDDRRDNNGGGNCEKHLAGASRNAGKDYCYVTLPSGCKDLEDSPVDGQDGQKISAEACNSGYEEVKLKHCWEKKYNYYSSLQEAKAACTSDRNCIGVYDHGCKRNGYYLCPKGSMEDVWYANDVKSCVHAKEGAKLCVKYETADFFYKDLEIAGEELNKKWISNVADVELTFINDEVVTFELDEPKVLGGNGEMCKFLTADMELKDVRIRQRQSEVSWAIQSLKIPKYVGSIFYYAFSMTGKNEMFWVDKNGDCTKNVQEGECCKDGKWCNLKFVEAGNSYRCYCENNVPSGWIAKSTGISCGKGGDYSYFTECKQGYEICFGASGIEDAVEISDIQKLCHSNNAWPLKAAGKSCTNYAEMQTRVETQVQCQALCELENGCVGITYSSTHENGQLCYVCYNTIAEKDVSNGFHYYQMPGVKGDDEKVFECDDKVSQGFKFVSYIDNQKETCDEEFQIGENVQGQGQEVCEENCSSNDECKFYFYSNNGWCNLYTACESTRVTKQSGTTLEKKECKITDAGTCFAGNLSSTKSGKTCQRWDTQTPHVTNNDAHKPERFPENSVELAGNKCRNPLNASQGPWCYTTDPETRWEVCDIPLC